MTPISLGITRASHLNSSSTSLWIWVSVRVSVAIAMIVLLSVALSQFTNTFRSTTTKNLNLRGDQGRHKLEPGSFQHVDSIDEAEPVPPCRVCLDGLCASRAFRRHLHRK